MKEPDESMKLIAPDWGAKDTLRKSSAPFVLWDVGDQPFLAHWLDEAFNKGCRAVDIEVADRPAEVRRFCESATLWPIQIRVQAVRETSPRDGAVYLDHLPWDQAPPNAPGADWEFMNFWWGCERIWFEHYRSLLVNPGNFLSIGRHCQIHPSVRLVDPYWIGDQVSVGPGCQIGPYAVIGHGSLLVGNSSVENARIQANTYLAPDTELKDAYLEGPRLFNRRLLAMADQLDAVIAGEVHLPAKAGIRASQRLRAGMLWCRYRKQAQALRRAGKTRITRTIQGAEFELLDDPDPFVARWPLYGLVISGKLPLVGIPPYDASDLRDINAEWKDCLRRAPVGAFGLSDATCPIGTPLENRVLHDVYQANCDAEEEINTIVRNFLRKE